ncbi:hypothetical protein FPZ43_01720 [Mucilaginibacter pallidiroseus]|uniref:Uncharacterized protein n=1 Tax=Mucilaginibacter pallidiroseus TaxID=2599295 RepID=A0A563UIJ4_9SPHI|nr:hypothetical protein [Mucilaginibacter pallidiroseus]TWR31220.1 hypothetical protein FPZ43_01720 [Mucilaginibacter pallidiroseus]
MKQYDVFLDGEIIGHTSLEKADAPMGVVFGRVTFININSAYSFFKGYCLENKIDFFEIADDLLINTNDIPTLKILSPTGTFINGLATTTEGMDTDGYDIYKISVPYPFYEEEFPEHVRAYQNKY